MEGNELFEELNDAFEMHILSGLYFYIILETPIDIMYDPAAQICLK